MNNQTSILDEVEKYIGNIYGESDGDVKKLTRFQIAVAVDEALAILVQNGVGHHVTTAIDQNITWNDFLYGHLGLADSIIEKMKDQNFARRFVCVSALLSFDPPLPSVIKLLQDSKAESLYRARLEYDIIDYTKE